MEHTTYTTIFIIKQNVVTVNYTSLLM